MEKCVNITLKWSFAQNRSVEEIIYRLNKMYTHYPEDGTHATIVFSEIPLI